MKARHKPKDYSSMLGSADYWNFFFGKWPNEPLLHFQVSNVFHESNYMSHVQRYSHMSFPWLIPTKAKRFFNNPDSFLTVMLVSWFFNPLRLISLVMASNTVSGAEITFCLESIYKRKICFVRVPWLFFVRWLSWKNLTKLKTRDQIYLP